MIILFVLAGKHVFSQQNCSYLQKNFTGTCTDYFESGKPKGKVDLLNGNVICEEVYTPVGLVMGYYDVYPGQSLDIRLVK